MISTSISKDDETIERSSPDRVLYLRLAENRRDRPGPLMHQLDVIARLLDYSARAYGRRPPCGSSPECKLPPKNQSLPGSMMRQDVKVIAQLSATACSPRARTGRQHA
ncbi:hypothetical protein J6590_006468 [Homalodisca vitripennis]|nr:hypothetical protein J6590_006468 [Homalodisca vitripennis]